MRKYFQQQIPKKCRFFEFERWVWTFSNLKWKFQKKWLILLLSPDIIMCEFWNLLHFFFENVCNWLLVLHFFKTFFGLLLHFFTNSWISKRLKLRSNYDKEHIPKIMISAKNKLRRGDTFLHSVVEWNCVLFWKKMIYKSKKMIYKSKKCVLDIKSVLAV